MLPLTAHVTITSRLHQDILKVLLYFDIFKHPLRADEIYSFLPSDSTSADAIKAECASPPLSSFLDQSGDYFSIIANGDRTGYQSSRFENEQRAKGYLRVARLVGWLLRRFPFVRAVFLSGELSKGVASRNGDIDFFLVTAENRLWISRTILILFKKTFLLNRKKFFCLNHFVAENHMDVTDHNVYHAVEIATLKPLYNEGLLAEYLSRNSWIKKFFPNLRPFPFPNYRTSQRSVIQKLLELPFRGRLGDSLERRLMEFWKSVWRRRYPGLTDEKRNRLFRCEQHISTAYAGDFLSKVLAEYGLRLRRFGLSGSAAGE